MKEITMLPPYIEPKHQKTIDAYQDMLESHNEMLVKTCGLSDSMTVRQRPQDVLEARRRFMEDTMRLYLIKQISMLKSMFEKQRFLIKGED